MSDSEDRGAGERGGGPSELQKRLEFLSLGPEDARRLQELQPAFDELAEQFVDSFYEHLLHVPETARFFRDEEQIARLKDTQIEHFRSMLQAAWNEAFVQERREVGYAHVEPGVEPQFFLGAYSRFLCFFLPKLFENEDRPSKETLHRVQSLLKAVFLDVGLTLDAYFQRSTEDLHRALEMLGRANTELKQFARFASHDLKTPLGTVANYCDEALDEFGEEIPDEAKELIESAQQTAYRMSATIDELLSAAVAHPSADGDAGRAVDSGAAVREAAERVRRMLADKQIRLQLPEEFPPVRGHPAQLREVFYNLLLNAAKYMDKPDGWIAVSVQQEETVWLFCVADNGPGIPAEERERIFDPFRRLASHEQTPGSGLGLHFARSLVEQQGGTIWVESQPGEGSRFFVRLPGAEDG